VWTNILALREATYPYFFPHSYLLPEEIEDQNHFDRIAEKLPLDTYAQFAPKIIPTLKAIEQERPFVGEGLWRLFEVYSILTGRTAAKMIDGKEYGRFYTWVKAMNGKEDIGLFSALRGVLTQDEHDIFYGNDALGALLQVRDIIEIKIIAEMNELIMGKQWVSRSIEEQGRIAELLKPITSEVYNPDDQDQE